MRRFGILAFAPILVLAQSTRPDPVQAPVLTIALYAPMQENSPVRVVGLTHDSRDIQFVLLNASERSIVGVVIGHIGIAPRGCSPEPSQELGEMHNGLRFQMGIGPHEQALATRRESNYSTWLVRMAQGLHVSHMLAEVKVVGVYFADGSTWPAQIPLRMDLTNLDRALADSESGRCTAVADVTHALQAVKKITFEGESSRISSTGDASAPSTLHLSCSLQGPKAVCRLPVSTQEAAPRAQSQAP